MSAALEATRDDAGSRYVGRVSGELVSEIDFRLDGDTMVITHTGTDPAHRGQGYAGELTRHALDDARGRGLRVVPRCPYTATWIEEHPEYADLVSRRW
jgi:predicted GNAT family acetyltransferase